MGFIADEITIPSAKPEPDTQDTCSVCEGGGWIAFGLGHGDPHFRVCDQCFNPEGHPCP